MFEKIRNGEIQWINGRFNLQSPHSFTLVFFLALKLGLSVEKHPLHLASSSYSSYRVEGSSICINMYLYLYLYHVFVCVSCICICIMYLAQSSYSSQRVDVTTEGSSFLLLCVARALSDIGLPENVLSFVLCMHVVCILVFYFYLCFLSSGGVFTALPDLVVIMLFHKYIC